MRRVKATIVLFVVALALALATVWVRTEVLALRYGIKQVAETKIRLEEELKSLTLEVTTLKTPQRMGRLATARFGLKAPLSTDIQRGAPPSASSGR